jgi:hypothetical protein
MTLHPVAALMDALASSEGPLSMADLHGKLGSEPFGLTFESQCLIVTALVSRGVLEFVTNSGNRIGSRSLDLKLVWEDVAGITMPEKAEVFDEALVRWAARLTGDEGLKSVSSETARESVYQALSQWTVEWKKRDLLARFERLPDHMITTELWHLGSRVRKSFGVVGDLLSSIENSDVSIKNSLRFIQEAFSGSEVEFLARSADADALESALRAAPTRNEIRDQLSFFEATDFHEVERSRRPILDVLTRGASVETTVAAGRLTAHWDEFRENFNKYLETRHQASARSHDIRDRANEIMASHEWWIYENLSSVEQFPTRFRHIIKEILRELRTCNCTADVQTGQPAFCAICGYAIKSDRYRSQLCGRMWETVNQSIVAYDHVLQRMKDDVLERAEAIAKRAKDKTAGAAARRLVDKLKKDDTVAGYDDDELRTLVVVFRELQAPTTGLHDVEESIPHVVTGEEIVEDVLVVQ